MDVKVIEELLGILVSPGTAGSDILENVFSANIKIVAEKINSSEKFQLVRTHLSPDDLCAEGDVQWQFARLNLRLIRLLQTVLDESVSASESAKHDDEHFTEKIPRQTFAPPLAADALSISQQKMVATSLQFIVCFGICPYLLPGVGLPLSRRCGFGGYVEAASSVSRDEMDHRLLTSTMTLLECVNGVSSKMLGEILISKHLGDLLAASFQICHTAARHHSVLHADKEKNLEIGQKSPFSVSCMVDCQNQSSCDNCSTCRSQTHVECRPQWHVEFWQKQLDVLSEKSYQPTLIQQLLVLQNGPPPSPTCKVEKVNMAPVPPPVWLRKLTRKCLVAAIMRSSGIQSLFAVLLQGENEKSTEWKRYDNIVKIVMDFPLGNSVTLEDYYAKISLQILELLQMNVNQRATDKDVRASHQRHCIRAAVQMVSLMALRQQQLTEKYFMSALLRPLLHCVEKPEDSCDSGAAGQSSAIVEESVLTSCIENIYTLTTGPDTTVVTLLCPVLGVLFPLYCHVRQSVTYLRNKVEEIMHWIFRHLDLLTALGFLSQFCLETKSHPIDQISENLKFCSGESGGLLILSQPKKKSALDISSCESLAQNVVHLIISSKRQDDLGAELFLLCLKRLSDIVSHEVDSGSGGNNIVVGHLGSRGRSVFGSSLLDAEDEAGSDEAKRIQRNLVIITLLTIMCEKIGPSCMNKSTHILSFIEATLTRGVKILESTRGSMFEAFQMETLSMALGLLTSLCADKEKISSLDWLRMQDLIPLLQKLSDSEADPSLQEMALDLRISIATHGLVHFGTESSNATGASGRESKSKRQSEIEKDKGTCPDSSRVPVSCTNQKKSSLIEVLSSTEVETSDPTTTKSNSVTFSPDSTTKDSPTYQQMAELVCDSSIPERGYALVLLRRLIEQKDAETLANAENILKICYLNLVHPDTYIYLSAIQVIAALACRCQQMVIPQLVKKYSVSSEEVKNSPELRMKLGEVLVKVSSGLGEMVPYYRDLLLGAILSATRDPDALVRASAMSNLGEICKLLRFALGNVIHEIFVCVSNLLKYDDNVEVRRGAAMFTTLLFQGLSKDLFEVLDRLSVDFLRLIKDVLKHDKDYHVRCHAQASFEVLEGIIHNFLTPPQTMEKHIRFP